MVKEDGGQSGNELSAEVRKSANQERSAPPEGRACLGGVVYVYFFYFCTAANVEGFNDFS